MAQYEKAILSWTPNYLGSTTPNKPTSNMNKALISGEPRCEEAPLTNLDKLSLNNRKTSK